MTQRTITWLVVYYAVLAVNRLTGFTDHRGGELAEIVLALGLCSMLPLLHLPWRVSLAIIGFGLFAAAAVLQHQLAPTPQQMIVLVSVVCITVALLTWRPNGKPIGSPPT
jgi:hypothetical protein